MKRSKGDSKLIGKHHLSDQEDLGKFIRYRFPLVLGLRIDIPRLSTDGKETWFAFLKDQR